MMARFEETIDLFGRDTGVATPGDIACGWCGKKHLGRQDAEGNPLPSSGDILSTKFGDLVVVECCFGRVEEAVLSRMGDIIPWFTRILVSDCQVLKQREGMITALCEVLADMCPR